MSLMWPSRSSAHLMDTRMPVAMADSSASTAWRKPTSAPSSFTRAKAKGWSSGCSGRGVATHDHVSTSPEVPTSTSSESSSAVTGSYSTGGTMTRPSAPRTPTTTCSRRPVRKALTAGPTVREKGYSMTSGARRTSCSMGLEPFVA